MESSNLKKSSVKPIKKEPAKNLEESEKPITNLRNNPEILASESRIITFDDHIDFILKKLKEFTTYNKVLEDGLEKLTKKNKENFSKLTSEEEEMKKSVSKTDGKMLDFEKRNDQIRQKSESKIDKGINKNSKKESELKQKIESKIEFKIDKIKGLKEEKNEFKIEIGKIAESQEKINQKLSEFEQKQENLNKAIEVKIEQLIKESQGRIFQEL